MGALIAAGLVVSLLASGPAPAFGQRSEAGASIWSATEWTDLDGKIWSAADLEGQVVLLDFWATWCAPCLAELPNLRRLDERFSSRGLVILGIALDTIDRRRLHSFLRRHDITWPQVHEPRGTESQAARRFRVEAVPSTLLIDPSGRVVARDLRGRALEVTVEALIGMR